MSGVVKDAILPNLALYDQMAEQEEPVIIVPLTAEEVKNLQGEDARIPMSYDKTTFISRSHLDSLSSAKENCQNRFRSFWLRQFHQRNSQDYKSCK